jgi:cytochrome c oxidase assembly protein subunit 15
MRSRAATAVTRGALWLLAAVLLQIVIGVATLLYQVPIDLGLAHQANAIVVLTLALFQAERLGENLPDTTPAKLRLATG